MPSTIGYSARSLLAGAALLTLCLGVSAEAADREIGGTPSPPSAAWSWAGSYIGLQAGGMIGTADFADPLGPSLFGDEVRIPGVFGGGQIGYNWQEPNSPFVFGAEAGLSWLEQSGTNTCLAHSASVVSANCRLRGDAVATLTGRVGLTVGDERRSLLYVKGGLAAVHDRADIATNGILPPIETDDSAFILGWTAGAGLERALTPAWSVMLEYDFLGFGQHGLATPEGFKFSESASDYAPTPPGRTHFDQEVSQVRLALNYRLERSPGGAGPHPTALPQLRRLLRLPAGRSRRAPAIGSVGDASKRTLEPTSIRARRIS